MAKSRLHLIVLISTVLNLSASANEKNLRVVEPFLNSLPYRIHYTFIQAELPYGLKGNGFLSMKRIAGRSADSNSSEYVTLEHSINIDNISIFYYFPQCPESLMNVLYILPSRDTATFYSTAKPCAPKNEDVEKYAPLFARYSGLVQEYNNAKHEYDILMRDIYVEVGCLTIFGIWTALMLSDAEYRDFGYLFVGIGVSGIIYDIVELINKKPIIKKYKTARQELKGWSAVDTNWMLDSQAAD